MAAETPPADAGRGGGPIEIPLLIALAFAVVAYGSVVLNSFYSDDFYHLYDLVNSSFAQFVTRMHGGHLYLFRNLVFVLCYRLFRTQPFLYYGLAFLTHVLNVFLFYRVVRAATGSARAACFGAVLWGTLPSNEGALGWYSVYGHALAATFTLAITGRMTSIAAGAAPIRFEPLCWAAGAVIGANCFGVGLGLAAAMPAAAWLLLPPSRLRTRAVVTLAIAVVLLPGLYLLVEHYDALLRGVQASQSARLVTMLREWPRHALLLGYLLIYATSSLFFGTFRSPSQMTSIDLRLGIAFFVIVALLIVLATRPARRQAIAFLMLAVAAYSIIALGRGLFVDFGKPAVLAAPARFHYVGPAMLVLALSCLVGGMRVGRAAAPGAKNAALAAWFAVALWGLQFGAGIDHHDSNRVEARRALANIRSMVETVPLGRDVYIENRKFISIGAMLFASPQMFPGWAALFAVYHPDQWIDGRRVRFIETDPEVLEEARQGRISSELLVAPEQMPPGARVVERPPPRRRMWPRTPVPKPPATRPASGMRDRLPLRGRMPDGSDGGGFE